MNQPLPQGCEIGREAAEPHATLGKAMPLTGAAHAQLPTLLLNSRPSSASANLLGESGSLRDRPGKRIRCRQAARQVSNAHTLETFRTRETRCGG